MFVIVRDEDVPTVAGAVSALADDAGLEAVPTDEEEADVPNDLFRAMGLQDVRISQTEAGVLLEGLDSLDIFEAEEWAAALGEACSAEVLAIDAAEVGLLVHVFDEEAEPPITVMRKGPRWDTAALAPLTDSDEGEAALKQGIAADDLDALAAQVLAHFGATPTGDAVTLAFTDPLEDEDEDEGEPGLRIELFQANELRGKVKGPVTATGPLFSVRLVGVPEIEGVRVVLGGEALALLDVEALEAHVRIRDANEVVIRTIAPSHADEEAVIFLLPDAYLAANTPALPALDTADLFSAMQALVSATGQTMLNTLVLTPVARGKRAGDATLRITVAALAHDLTAAGEVDVHVTR